jgi:hypothetical protein
VDEKQNQKRIYRNKKYGLSHNQQRHTIGDYAMTRGFVILAQNTEKTNYVKCAEVLAKSIRKHMPNANISLISDDIDYSPYFDKVIALPYGDLAKDSDWKLVNDWQVYEASPYDETIKLEADLYIPRSIEYWWDVLSQQDVVISTHIRNYKQEISNVRYYRKFIDYNKLPDCYNALTYYKKSELAERFFQTVKNIFDNWAEYRSILQCKTDEEVTTDWAYALACHIMGVEKTTMPNFQEFSMVHMKQMINELNTENWTDEMIYEISQDSIRINTVPQLYPFHYHVKKFSNKLDI